jgi:hypothetical protein
MGIESMVGAIGAQSDRDDVFGLRLALNTIDRKVEITITATHDGDGKGQ